VRDFSGGCNGCGSDKRDGIAMDSLITAASRALAAGDPLGALKRVALREDAPALALRGIAMAQLGELARAKALLRRASRAFAPKESLARARCVLAQAEVALASRELAWPVSALTTARAVLEAHRDEANAAHAAYLEIRRLLLIGRLEEAELKLSRIDPLPLPPALQATHALVQAGIALRRVDSKRARSALLRAQLAARAADIPALSAEVAHAQQLLDAPAARLIAGGVQRTVSLAEVDQQLRSGALVVDGCRRMVTNAKQRIVLARRPVLFTLARVLAEAWPDDVRRDQLIALAFRGKHADESYRARLRVEVGRLRQALRAVANVHATARGFVLLPRAARRVVVLAQPLDEEQGSVLAVLSDGQSWSSSALALALGASQRTVQRTLESLAHAGKVQSFGRGRSLRWLTPPVPGFTTTLLLPPPLPLD
jgi:hypothetical protein